VQRQIRRQVRREVRRQFRRQVSVKCSAQQAAAHGKSGEPHQPCKAEAAEHSRRTEIFDAPNIVMLLPRNMVGQFFDRSVKELDRKQDQQGADHAGVPGAARGYHEP